MEEEEVENGEGGRRGERGKEKGEKGGEGRVRDNGRKEEGEKKERRVRV